MKIINIPKKSGGHRTIYVVYGEEANKYKLLVGELAQYASKLDKENVMHGFVKSRSAVTAALAHVNHAWTVCFDLADFFDHVSADKLKNLIPAKMIEKVIVDGAARQGLPTSPSAANIAASKMDKSILRFIEKKKIDVVYTRYADDLTFSGDHMDQLEIIKKEIPIIVKRCGWLLRDDKTHIQLSSNGRRHICGVAVDSDGIHPTRRAKRRLRAAQHQALTDEKAKQKAHGLEEWCKLKEPKPKPEPTIKSEKVDELNKELKALSKAWDIKVPNMNLIPDKGEDIIEGDFMITGDPVYILGCSTWTTGWRSCLSHTPAGTHRKGSIFWMRFPGTRMAALLSNREREVVGVTRRLVRARAFVHTLRDGRQVYDRVYGDNESANELREEFNKRGIEFVKSLPKGIKVMGNLASVKKPYLDNLTSTIISVITYH